MIQPNRVRRRVEAVVASLIVAAASLGLVLGRHDVAEAVAEDKGAVTISAPDGAALTGGGSATEFRMTPPTDSACPGSGSGTPPYRWQTFFVADSVDVSALTYASGPQPVGTAFVFPMFDHAGGNPVQNQNPSASPLGLISNIPTFDFAAFAPPSTPPDGTYKIGFACTTAGATVSYWTGRITVTADQSDSPGGFTWTVAAPPPPPNPPITNLAAEQIAGPGVHLSWTAPTGTAPDNYTVGVTPTVAGAPFTTLPGSTSLDITNLVSGTAYTLSVTANYSVAPLTGPTATVQFTFVPPSTSSSSSSSSSSSTSSSSTSSSSTSSTTSTTSPTSSSTSSSVVATSSTVQNVAALPVSATTTTVFVTTLATTGASPLSLMLWAALLLAFGRIVVLIARRPQVLPPARR